MLGENGGHLLEQGADLLFIVLSHGHVFGAPYPGLGFNSQDALSPCSRRKGGRRSSALLHAMNALFLHTAAL